MYWPFSPLANTLSIVKQRSVTMSPSQAIYSRAEERRAVHFPGLYTLDWNGCELGRIIVLFTVAELEMNIGVSPWAELTLPFLICLIFTV